MGRRQLFLCLLFIFPVLVVYNNCSRSVGQTEGAYLGSSTFISGVDNGFSGQGRLEFYMPEPSCADELGQASQSLVMDWNSNSATIESQTCDNVWSGSIDYSSVEDNGYNAAVVYYKNRLFVAPLFHEGVTGHFYYKEFCFNEVLQQDFLLQYIEETVPGVANPVMKWTGITIFGPQTLTPGVLFNGGFLQVMNDGSKIFSTHNETFHVKIDPPGLNGVGEAHYMTSDGSSVGMTCWSWID